MRLREDGRAALAAELMLELAAVFDARGSTTWHETRRSTTDLRARFEAELAQPKLSEARCARVVCPSAAPHFGGGSWGVVTLVVAV